MVKKETPYGCVHDANAVRSNGIGHVSDVRRAKEFAVARALDEHLRVDVVVVLRNESVQVTQNIQHITSLRNETGDDDH